LFVFSPYKPGFQLPLGIVIAEYISTFGYDASFNTIVCQTLQNPIILRQSIPARTMTAVANHVHEILALPMHTLLCEQAERYDIDLSVPALFNGIITTELPNDEAWTQAYQNDKSSKQIIEMLDNPLLITTTRLPSIDPIYRSALGDSHIRMNENCLCLFEPIASSTKQLQLVIVPLDLQQHIFTSFHVNPLRGHLSLYYTLHKIRLRFHWPHMYKYIKYAISSCAACLLRNHPSRPALELLYAFPIDAPMLTIHADAWMPGKTTSFDGYTGLMIVMCHMTGFTVIEPLKDMNSTTFAKAVYALQLRYGLAHLLVINADSKFKGEFIKAAELLKIKLHPVARGSQSRRNRGGTIQLIPQFLYHRLQQRSQIQPHLPQRCANVLLHLELSSSSWNRLESSTPRAWPRIPLPHRFHNMPTSNNQHCQIWYTILCIRHARLVGKMSTHLQAVDP
jgi:hypothetical protein